MSSFKAYFESLAGGWQLTRSISSGEKFSGKAEFKPVADNVFLLSENGELKMCDGTCIPASRSWHWALSRNGELFISYDETPPRLYHHLLLQQKENAWTGTADHICTPDLYQGQYRFEGNRILIEQQITGPKKDYTVSSLFERP